MPSAVAAGRTARRRWPRPPPPPGRAWHGLIRKGKDPLAVGVTGIANNAIRYVRNGRRVGNTTCGRGAMDVFTARPRRPAASRSSASTPDDQFIPRFAGRDVEGVAGLRQPGRPGRRGLLPARLRRLARGPARAEAPGRGATSRGARGGRRRPHGRDRAVAGVPAPVRAGGLLAGIPGAGRRRPASGPPSRPPDLGRHGPFFHEGGDMPGGRTTDAQRRLFPRRPDRLGPGRARRAELDAVLAGPGRLVRARCHSGEIRHRPDPRRAGRGR